MRILQIYAMMTVYGLLSNQGMHDPKIQFLSRAMCVCFFLWQAVHFVWLALLNATQPTLQFSVLVVLVGYL